MSKSNSHQLSQARLYDEHLLDDLSAGAGYFGFNKPKTIRDLEYQKWVKKLNIKKTDKILDFGCNAGASLEKIRRQYQAQCYGVDISPKTVAQGKLHFPKLKLSSYSGTRLPFADNFFDKVVSFEVLEHVSDHEQTIKEMARVLKPGGKMLVYAISARNALTYHWLQYQLSGGRYGTGALRDHLPELMVPIEKLAKWANKFGLRIRDFSTFHSFFTLIHDEPWTNLLASFALLFKSNKNATSEIKIQKSQTSDQTLPVSGKFQVYKIWLYFWRFALSILDLPWKLFKLSDGFFAIFIKTK